MARAGHVRVFVKLLLLPCCVEVPLLLVLMLLSGLQQAARCGAQGPHSP
jgi:hypothetical protein